MGARWKNLPFDGAVQTSNSLVIRMSLSVVRLEQFVYCVYFSNCRALKKGEKIATEKAVDFLISNFADFRRKNILVGGGTFKKCQLQEKIFRQLATNFADFSKNNRVFLQKNHTFKKYGRKVIIQGVYKSPDPF